MQKFPTVAACDMIGLPRQRLNEDIASGAYPCPPELSSERVGRFWDEHDLCALRVYTFFLNVYGAEGTNHKPAISKRVAGLYAQCTLEALRKGVQAPRLDFPITGFNDEWEACDSDEPPNFVSPSGVGAIATLCLSLEDIRADVQARIAHRNGEAVG